MDLPSFEDIFRPINSCLKLSALPYGKPVLSFWFYFFMLVLNLLILAEACFFVSKISSENFLELTALAPCLGVGILSAVKMISVSVKRHKLFDLIDRLRELYTKILEDNEKINVVGREIIVVKSLTRYYFILNGLLITVYNFSSLVMMIYLYIVNGKVIYGLPYSIIVPISTDVWYKWLIVYIFSIFGAFIAVLFFVTVDALYCNLTSQVCTNFTTISNEVENLTPSNAHTLPCIVKKHQYIIKLSEILEEIFTIPNLSNVVVGSLEICALGFNIMTGDLSKMPGFVLFLTSVILQILIMSVFGENLIRESRKVGDAVFLCEWYNMETKYKKMLLIILTRTNKPQKLTAFKFSVISYGSFTKIISTAWSYFTILKTIYKPSEVKKYVE